jgi:hypothetical protein
MTPVTTAQLCEAPSCPGHDDGGVCGNERLHVLDGFEHRGAINTTDDQIVANIQHSIRLGYPQLCGNSLQTKRVCLVGGGPSLESTLPALRELYFAGAEIVTLNGAYQWCIERNIQPSAQIVMDARPSNARFVQPAIPRTKYFLASQCAPETWKAVEGRPNVYIWHAAAPDNETLAPILNAYYGNRWQGTPGGTTVAMRAVIILSIAGYLRFDLFGIDSCFMDGKGHAYAQPENDEDRAAPFVLAHPDKPETRRTFLCTGWHAKQLECFLQMIRLHGHRFKLHVHGDGLLAHALKCGASPTMGFTTADAPDGCIHTEQE